MLLEQQLAGCKQQLEVVQWEHEYIKDQLTTTEVRTPLMVLANCAGVGVPLGCW